MRCCVSDNILFGGWTDVDFVLFTARFEFIGNCYIVTEQTIAWHFTTNNSCQNCASVNTNSHL